MTQQLEIRVRGSVPAEAVRRLGLSVSAGTVETVLRGPVADRSALHGVLDRLCANDIEVLEVRRLPEPERRRP
jgi:hypothetical protein